MDKMTTYAETQGEKPFDWNAFLNRDDVTEDEWEEALDRSRKWVSCAVGNMCSIIPRYQTGMLRGKPLDELLGTWGNHFHSAIAARDTVDAKEILDQIERRSAELIKDILFTTNA